MRRLRRLSRLLALLLLLLQLLLALELLQQLLRSLGRLLARVLGICPRRRLFVLISLVGRLLGRLRIIVTVRLCGVSRPALCGGRNSRLENSRCCARPVGRRC